MAAVLITGSIAYDTVCRLGDRFENLILPEKVSALNLTFLASSMRKSFGGCAANIAWSLKLLGGDPRILSAVGRDGDEYLRHLEEAGIDTRLIARLEDEWTAQVFITADERGNQLATFLPGAMERSAELPVPKTGIALAHISPGTAKEMVTHAKQCLENHIPYVFDPGQTTSQLSPEALLALAEGAFLVCLSDYEATLFEKRTGTRITSLISPKRTFLVTHGAEGSEFRTQTGLIRLPAAPATRITSTVGAGDAFRGGLLRGLSLGLSWEACGKMGALMATLKLEAGDPQGFRPSIAEIRDRYEAAWKEPLPC